MSDSVNNSNGGNPTNPAQGQPAAQPAVDMSKVSGAEAVELAREAKATGKTIEEIYAAKQKGAAGRGPDGKFQSSQPKEPSTQEALKEAAAEAKRKLKIKEGDQEVEIDEDEVVKVYKSRKEHQRAANKELQEGKAARKQAEEFLSMMKDPEKFWEVAEKLGHKNRELAERLMVKQLEDELMDPREKELRDAKAKLKQIEDMEKAQKEQLEAKRMEEMKQKYVKDFETQFISALQESQLPPTKPMIAEMAKKISQAAKIGYKLSPKEAATLVKEDVQKAQLNLVGNADGETLLRLFGDEVAKKILQARGAKVKQQGFGSPSDQPERRELQTQKSGRMSPEEWSKFKRGIKK